MFSRLVGVGVALSLLLILEARRRRFAAAAERRRLIRENPELPTEIISDILIRLPATSLQRFKSVSKQWFQIISDTKFAESHLYHHKLDFELIFCKLVDTTGGKTFFFERDPRVAYARKRKMLAGFRVHGSCKGLILLERCSVFFVVNPVTGRIQRLPYHGIGWPFNANIGFSRSSREFKVVMVDYDCVNGVRRNICRVLTLHPQGTSPWRELDVPFYVSMQQFYKNPLLARGCLHWIRTGYNTIISMNLETEKLYEQPAVPKYCPTSNSSIYGSFFLEWDGCLALIPEHQGELSYSIFTLMESGWKTELGVDINFFKHLCPTQVFEGAPPYPVASFGDGEVILFMDVSDQTSFFAYHLGTKVMTPFTMKVPGRTSVYRLPSGYCPAGSIMPHMDSLVSW